MRLHQRVLPVCPVRSKLATRAGSRRMKLFRMQMQPIKGIIIYHSVVSRPQTAPRPAFRGNYPRGCQMVASVNDTEPSVAQ